jgi:hypothetical protein
MFHFMAMGRYLWERALPAIGVEVSSGKSRAGLLPQQFPRYPSIALLMISFMISLDPA